MDNNVVTGKFTSPSLDGLVTAPILSIGSTAFRYMIGGKIYDKAAVVAGTALTATTVPAGKYGVFGFEIGANGTIDNLDAPANATGYTTAEAATLAAKPSASASHVLFMYFTVQAKSGAAWTGATDYLVAGSDCEAVNFYDETLAEEVSQYGVTPLNGETGSAIGLRVGYHSKFFYPGDTFEYEAER